MLRLSFLSLIAVLACTAAPLWAGTLLISDTFDDGTAATNTLGVGGSANASVFNGNVSEESVGISELLIEGTGDFTNGGLINDTTKIDLINPTGATLTVKVGKVVVDREGDIVAADFGVFNNINTSPPGNSKGLVPYHNDDGGLLVLLRFHRDSGSADTELKVEGSIVAINQDKQGGTGVGGDSGNIQTLGTFVFDTWDGQAFMEAALFINEDGFQVAFDQAVVFTPQVAGFSPSGSMSWANVQANAVFEDPGFDLDAVFTNGPNGTGAHVGVGIDSGRARGDVRYDLYEVETGNTIPEPTTVMLLGMGLLAGLGHRR